VLTPRAATCVPERLEELRVAHLKGACACRMSAILIGDGVNAGRSVVSTSSGGFARSRSGSLPICQANPTKVAVKGTFKRYCPGCSRTTSLRLTGANPKRHVDGRPVASGVTQDRP